MLILAPLFSSNVRRILENSYIGAPPILLFNALRPYLGSTNNEECFAELEVSGVAYRRKENEEHKASCPDRHLILIAWPLKEKRYMTCRLALAINRYRDEVIQPLVKRFFGTNLSHIVDNGVRSCRTMTGHRFLLSEHAYANAIDITDFELENGLVINIEKDWGDTSTAALFLKEAASNACKVFNMVISPDYNEVHKDHFHLDVGLAQGCN